MNKQSTLKLIVGLIAISFLNVACQGNLQSDFAQKGVEDTAPLKTPEDLESKVDIAAVEKSVAESELAMEEAKEILSRFSNPDGSIKIWSLMFSSSSSADVQAESIFIIYEKLSEVLDKIVVKVAEVKGKFNEVRAQLASEASKLDPSRPDHKLILDQINLMMAQIDRAESQFSVGLGQLAGQLDMVNRGIDVLTASAGGLFPGAGIIVGFLTNQVKMAITEFQTKLRNL